jgi:hypothetical protein
MNAEATTSAAVRAVTDDEARRFAANGWVKLDQLVSPVLAAQLLERAKGRVAQDPAGLIAPPDHDALTEFEEYRSPVRDDEPFDLLATSQALGRAAALLLGRDSSIRLVRDLLDVTAAGDRSRLQFHQDAAFLPVDRNAVTFWIALDDVASDQIPLLFYTGSHRFGSFGFLDEVTDESWPQLQDCAVAAPNQLAPGDATAYVSQLVHGPSANGSDQVRWGYSLTFAPGDARYVDLPTRGNRDLGLVAFERLDHPDFPLVYDGMAAAS